MNFIKAAHVRHKRFDYECTPLAQVPSCVLEAAHLLFLGEQGEEGVEDYVYQREPLLQADLREVGDAHGDLPTTGFGTQLVDHGLRGVDAVDFDPLLCQGE